MWLVQNPARAASVRFVQIPVGADSVRLDQSPARADSARVIQVRVKPYTLKAPAADSAGAIQTSTRPDSAGVHRATARPRLARAAGTAARADTDSTGAPRKPWYRRPKWIMLRSVVFPGWGQWANGRHVKAVIFGAGEGYLAWQAVDWGLHERDKDRLGARDSSVPALQQQDIADAQHAAQRRRDFTWWTIFAVVFSMGDAYVDAQLGKFDVQFKPQDAEGASHFRSDQVDPHGADSSDRSSQLIPAGNLSIGLRFRFP